LATPETVEVVAARAIVRGLLASGWDQWAEPVPSVVTGWTAAARVGPLRATNRKWWGEGRLPVTGPAPTLKVERGWVLGNLLPAPSAFFPWRSGAISKLGSGLGGAPGKRTEVRVVPTVNGKGPAPGSTPEPAPWPLRRLEPRSRYEPDGPCDPEFP
jgi:hypothetical protein